METTSFWMLLDQIQRNKFGFQMFLAAILKKYYLNSELLKCFWYLSPHCKGPI